MPVLSRRLYNGGFNHLKCARDLVRKPTHVVTRTSLLVRQCSSLNTVPESNDNDPAELQALSDQPTREDHHNHHHCNWHISPFTDDMSVTQDFVKANEQYVANFGDKGSLPIPPSKKLAIITCMDARVNPFTQLGLTEGDAHIIRNAGGVAKDAIRSIVISQRLLGTREIAVFHHTGCGMLSFTTPQLRSSIKDAEPHNAAAVDEIDFLEFSDLDRSVKDDVKFLLRHPLVLPGTKITGWVYEVETGKIRQVV